jgi:hypothetical protein
VKSLLLVTALLASPPAASLSDSLPWSELSLSIEEDPGTSSDQVTLCRVRVENHGPHTWPGRNLHFEARAYDAGVLVEVARGHFGLSLPPRGSLETLIAFSGVYRRFEVVPADSSSAQRGKTRSRSSAAKPRRRASRRKL